jgi:hypothetical protein
MEGIMAQVVEQFLVFKVSKLVRGTADGVEVLDTESKLAIEALLADTLSQIDPTAIIELEG